MADFKAAATGLWSAPGTWSGGVVPSGATDVVYSNNFTVTVDQDVAVGTLTNASGGTVAAVAGGSFTVTGNRSIAANTNGGANLGNSLGAVTYSGTDTFTYIGSPVGGTGGGFNALAVTGVGCTVNITGTPTGGAGSNAQGVVVSSLCTVNVTGDCLAGVGGYGVSVLGGNPTLVINGNVKGYTTGATGSAGIQVTSTATVTINGYALGGGAQNSYGANLSAGTTTVTGTVTGGANSSAYGINMSGAANLTVGGVVAGGNGNTAQGISSSSSGFVTVNNAVNSGGGASANGIAQTGAGTITVVGNVTGGVASAITLGSTASTCNVTGNVTGGTGANMYGLYATQAGVVMNVTGNVTGGSGSSASGVQQQNVAATVNVTGTVTGGTNATAYGIFLGSNGIANVYGTCVGSATGAPGMSFSNSGQVAFVQIAKGNDYPNSGVTVAAPDVIFNTATNSVTVDAMETGTGGVMGVGAANGAPRVFLRSAGTNYFKGYQSNAGTVLNLGEIAADYPLIADVREGIVYDFGAKIGTCDVPPAGSVAFGVPVDATTGTAALTPTDIGNAVWQRAIESGLTAEEVLRIMLAPLAGLSTGTGTTQEKYYGRDGTTERLVVDFDGTGNRTTVVIDGS